MPSLRERKKADTRTRLSAAAVELLVAEGAEGATVSAIAGRAGVSTRTFHNYFAHREDAFLHFLREQIAEFVRQVDQAHPDLTPVDIFRTMFRELYGRSSDDIEAAENLFVAGEQIGIMLSSDARSCLAEQILDPLYDAIGRREPQLSRFRWPGSRSGSCSPATPGRASRSRSSTRCTTRSAAGSRSSAGSASGCWWT